MKKFLVFSLFKSYFKLLKLLGACLLHLLEGLQPVELLLGLRHKLGAYPTRLKQSVFFSERSNIAQIFEDTQALPSVFLLPLIIAAWLLLLYLTHLWLSAT